MKHSMVLKFIAVFMAALALTVTLASAFGVALLASNNLYNRDEESWRTEITCRKAEVLAQAMAESYAARNLGGFTTGELQHIGWGNTWQTIGSWNSMDPGTWCYTIARSGSVKETSYDRRYADAEPFTFDLRVQYPENVSSSAQFDERYYMHENDGQTRFLYVRYETSPVYTVTVWIMPGGVREHNGVSFSLYQTVMQLRYVLIGTLVAGLMVTAVCLVYIFCAAGKKHSLDAPAPGGFNRLPLDVYALGVGLCCLAATAGTVEILGEFLYRGDGFNWGWLALGATLVFCAALGVVGLLMALAAQWKMHGFYIWRHSVTGWCCSKLWKGICKAGGILCKLFKLLPLVWRYLLTGLAMGIFPLWFFYLAAAGESFWAWFLLLACLVDVAVIGYGAYAFGTVLQGAKKMAQGALSNQISTQYLLGAYRDCARELNALADVAVVAAKNQTRSERMKTELITNVSHDIKTPLTSIINYIDLLQRAQTPEESAQYLQVLDRQAQGLKKLIEDLMEMSKATTGDMAVEIAPLDAVEAVNQALGEFADKLAGQALTVVFQQPEKPVPVLADGRLTWRVMSNLLSNVVKYALPGTRVYVDLMHADGMVYLRIKNISREALNVSADELTERFVRGDLSRNTEGSGLGLHIAKSLMELQKGRLDLLVDGDLFKVTLTFPTVQ